MIKTTVIKAKTVSEASETYGEEAVQKIFELISNKAPKDVFEELEDDNLKKCLLFLLNGDIS
jgi:hypothetical protein